VVGFVEKKITVGSCTAAATKMQLATQDIGRQLLRAGKGCVDGVRHLGLLLVPLRVKAARVRRAFILGQK